MSDLYIPVILGTARVGRRSESVAKVVLAFLQKLEIETKLLDVRDFPLTHTEEVTPAIENWKQEATRADGFVVVTPEYNHGYPGELKLFLDSVYKELGRKPIGFVGVSKGTISGARAIEQLRLVSIEFHMVPIRSAVYVGEVIPLLDESGNFKDPSLLEKKLTIMTEELLWYAKALKTARG